MKGLGNDGRYWEALAAGHVEMPVCAGCGEWHWPAVFRCGSCGSWDMDWRVVSLQGRIFTWARSWHSFGGADAIGSPYVSVSVELPSAGDRRLLGILDGDTADLRIGAPVVGKIATTRAMGKEVPAIRWSIDVEGQ